MKKIQDIVLTTVVHNEGSSLLSFVRDLDQIFENIIIADQSSTDGSIQDLQREFPEVQVFKTLHTGYCESDLHLLQELTGNQWSLRLDCDERVTPQIAGLIRDRIHETDKMQFQSFWIRRKNTVNGRDIQSLMINEELDPQGYDWQTRLVRNHGARFESKPHQPPMIVGKFSYLDPRKIWIEHDRDFRTVLNSNMLRSRYITDQKIQTLQNNFIQGCIRELEISESEFMSLVDSVRREIDGE